jgi:hypothetical protein
MKQPAIAVSLILGIALVLCTWIAGSAVESFGRSLERVAQFNSLAQTNSAIPSVITFRLGGDPNAPLRVVLNDK